GFFGALGIPLLEGRTFDAADDASQGRVAVLSAAAARGLFGDRPLGRTMPLPTTQGGSVQATIVGVVGEVRYKGLAGPPEPTVYVPFAQQPWPTAFLVVRTAGDPASAAAALRRA